jgi:hypothetical protein
MLRRQSLETTDRAGRPAFRGGVPPTSVASSCSMLSHRLRDTSYTTCSNAAGDTGHIGAHPGPLAYNRNRCLRS